jgi:hypothetical protein
VQDFHYVIKGYCKDSFGWRFVERGDYEVMHTENSQAINRSELGTVVESGMILEMSIILRQRKAFLDNKEKCPRCGRLNLNVTANQGWIEWQVPLNYYTYFRLTFVVAAGVQGSFKSQSKKITRTPRGAVKRVMTKRSFHPLRMFFIVSFVMRLTTVIAVKRER